ncbi:MAG: NADH-quinone oxidoreductase subunit C [Labilithrix sp.]|nr:NADH-quinone oxidoreductase subunit C [Labilithrix sp.]MCW5814323.1 NADH-quinone oxidoreductase subunit C [Labilithrix sp.]
MSVRALEALKNRFGDVVVETHSDWGDDTAVVKAESWKEVCRFLRDDPSMAFDMPVDLCAVDFPERSPRFEIVLHLYSVGKRQRLRLKARVGDAEGDDAAIDSVTDVWVGVNWYERETYDLMGIQFKGHPDLRRILMYPEFEGHPLRKDYPANKTQPLVPYRTEEEAGLTLDKQAPFGIDEGMPFGRRTFDERDN